MAPFVNNAQSVPPFNRVGLHHSRFQTVIGLWDRETETILDDRLGCRLWSTKTLKNFLIAIFNKIRIKLLTWNILTMYSFQDRRNYRKNYYCNFSIIFLSIYIYLEDSLYFSIFINNIINILIKLQEIFVNIKELQIKN